MSHDHADPDAAGSLHHVELATAAFERSAAFWDWFLRELDYERKDDWEDGRSWEHGRTYVTLVETERATPAFDGAAPGLDHLAFHARSRDHVDALTRGVRRRDAAAVLYEDQHPYAGGYYALYCENPDGLKVEVVAPD